MSIETKTKPVKRFEYYVEDEEKKKRYVYHEETWKELTNEEMDTKRLAKNQEGIPFFRLDEQDVMRYVLNDGTLDPRSTVNTDLPHIYDIRSEGGMDDLMEDEIRSIAAPLIEQVVDDGQPVILAA